MKDVVRCGEDVARCREEAPSVDRNVVESGLLKQCEDEYTYMNLILLSSRCMLDHEIKSEFLSSSILL